MRQYVLTFLGLFLLVVGLLGPFTFADDLRHFGEVAVAIGFSLAGFFLLAPRLFGRWRCGASFPLASPFVILGLVAGTFLAETVAGMLLGACVGAAVVWRHCRRLPPVAI